MGVCRLGRYWREGSSRTSWAAILGLACLSGCSSPTVDDQAAGVCAQIRGWAVGGCVAIEGQVVGARDQPLGGIFVGPRPSADGWQFNTVYVQTDGTGQFGFRIFQIAASANGVVSDTVALWIRATVTPTLPQTIATAFDSALVRVVIAPIGQVPTPGLVRIILPVQ